MNISKFLFNKIYSIKFNFYKIYINLNNNNNKKSNDIN